MKIPLDRYDALMNEKAELTKEEIEDGWHFCCEWDALLIHPSWEESKVCTCLKDWKGKSIMDSEPPTEPSDS
jgi:hypothetical protein